MGKRLMTLSDLYNYYSAQGKTQSFSSNDDNDTIVVQIDGNLNFEKTECMDGLYPTRVQMNFIGDNLNGSRIQMNAQKAALSSSHYRPLLACIHEVDGEPQFWGHNMHQENGEIVYDEQPIGVIVEEAHIEHDEEYDKDYAVAMGYIWEEYSKASYIIERDQRCDVSVELSIRSLSYDAKDGILVLDDFYYSGCTVLGYNEDGSKVNPAMPGSNITLADFSVKNENTVDSDKLNQILDKLNTVLSKFEEKSKEGGNQTMFEELLNKYSKTVEDITFEYENLTDEELEVAFAEAFAEVDGDNDGDGAEPEAPASEEPEADPTEPTEDEDDGEDEPQEDKAEFSVVINGEKKTFSLSLNDKLNAMYSLVNETYGDLDCDYYDVNVFEDEGIVEMYGLFSGKAYRQNFKCKKKKEYSLVGDRTEIFAKYLTQDEINAFEKMKAEFEEMQPKFEEVSSKLTKYEEEPKKAEILGSQKYSYVAGTEEFEELKNNHFDLSIEEVTSKANDILLQYAESGALKFSTEQPEQEVSHKSLLFSNKKTGRYGDLFSK